MLDKPVRNSQVSWETMQGTSAIVFFISLPDIESILTLICLTLMLIGLGISPLYIKSESVSIAIASCVMIALGSGIGGLTIATLLERLLTETPTEIKDSWVAGVVLICSSLGILAWVFIVLRISPVSRLPLVAVVLFAAAGVYSLIYGILITHALVLINVIVSDILRVTADSEQMIGFIVSGGAIVGWARFVMRKTAPTNFKILVPAFTIFGVIYIGFGIALATLLISC